MLSFYASPDAEAAAVRRAAARSGCRIRSLEARRSVFGPTKLVGALACADGWTAAVLLLALAEEDAATLGARRIAQAIRSMAPDDVSFARAVHSFVRGRVRFALEEGEIFQSGAFTLAQGYGDCDDHFRLVYAIAKAGGLDAKLGILHHGTDVPPEKQGPAHAAALLCPRGGPCAWAETTVAARYGETPNDAARRLGLTNERSDIAKEVVIMSSQELPPLPDDFRDRNSPAQVKLDVEALQRLGYLSSDACTTDAGDPMLRAAVLAFQLASGIVGDGELGPETRLTIARALRSANVTDFAYTMAGLAAPAAKLTARIPDEFLRQVGAIIRRWRAAGATVTGADLLGVMRAESGISSSVPNGGGSPCYGLNQLCTCETTKNPGVYPCFRAVGFTGTPAEFLSLSLVNQLPFVARYFENAVRGAGGLSKLTNGTSLYLANIAPAFMAHADEPDFRIYVDPDRRYTDNRGVDADGDKAIEVRELQTFIDKAIARDVPFWNELMARYAVLGDEPPASFPLAGLVVAGGIVATVGGALWAHGFFA